MRWEKICQFFHTWSSLEWSPTDEGSKFVNAIICIAKKIDSCKNIGTSCSKILQLNTMLDNLFVSCNCRVLEIGEWSYYATKLVVNGLLSFERSPFLKISDNMPCLSGNWSNILEVSWQKYICVISKLITSNSTLLDYFYKRSVYAN